MLDLIIKNATVIDGTGAAPFLSDIGIENGKIAALGVGLSGAPLLDATGLTVTPGFIDSHSHSDESVLTFPDQKEKVEQGITYSITGQCGGSAAPRRDADTGKILTVAEYLGQVSTVPQGSHSAMLIGHGSIRGAVMGQENRAPSQSELAEMKRLLAEGLAAGAKGMSIGLFYTPGAYADTAEVVALAEVVAAHGGILASHLRNEGDTLLEAAEEFLSIVEQSGCRAVFSHHKAMEKQNHGKTAATLAMIDRANARGADLYLDVYPYLASHTDLFSRFVPSPLHPKGAKSRAALLADKDFCRAVKEWGHGHYGTDLSFALVTSYEKNLAYEGKNINEIAALRGEADPYDTVLSLLQESGGKGYACYFTMCEEDLSRVIAHPRAMLCTDAPARGNKAKFHPRLVGAFPRAIATYVRERGVVSLPEMIRKMTALPASVYNLAGKGVIRVGMDADLCIFDAARIRDRADFVNCTLPNEGIHTVLIDGKIVLENGRYNGTRAARVFTKV